MITGISHVTFSVRDLDVAVRFYTDVLGCRLRARWPKGAYLEAGDLWLALALDPDTRSEPVAEQTHTAFSVAEPDFGDASARIRASGAAAWRSNTSEGASLYFLDPDGHKLEIHVGTLASRLRTLEGEGRDGPRGADGGSGGRA